MRVYKGVYMRICVGIRASICMRVCLIVLAVRHPIVRSCAFEDACVFTHMHVSLHTFMCVRVNICVAVHSPVLPDRQLIIVFPSVYVSPLLRKLAALIAV
jgi:hypothetical protein